MDSRTAPVDTSIAHLSVEERAALGERARQSTPPSAQGEWRADHGRADPIDLLVEQNATREPDLVPVRHGRMSVSPFTFYRGAAKIMATDLAGTPTAGLSVQLCGDAHLSNFGAYASPERQLLFDLNDFDETLPGPFEYDVKRLAASFTIAGRNNGFTRADIEAATLKSASSSRNAMIEFAALRTLDVWYANMSETTVREAVRAVREGKAGSRKADTNRHGKKGRRKGTEATAEAAAIAKAAKAADKTLRRARTRDHLNALPRFAELVDGRHRIVSQPPVLVPLRELAGSLQVTPEELRAVVEQQFLDYQGSLSADRRQLLRRFSVVDMARKVVGVGSVGTRSFMVLLQGRDDADPLFLQVKEATRSVLEDHLPKSRYENPGERVVQGQRMLQAASDIFLGWTEGAQADRFYYWRQLRDMKASANVEAMKPFALTFYAGLCGWALARAHARSGDPVAIAEYLGRRNDFEVALVRFSESYADQNERDYHTFLEAIADGRITAVRGV
jgi:uncharacterized protein (DUF2252 family)